MPLGCYMPLAASVALGAVLAAQAPSVAFEVASIKANHSNTGRINLEQQPGGRFIAVNATLMGLILVSYGPEGSPLPGNRLTISSTFPDKDILSEHYDIEAKSVGDLTRVQLQ